jgi:hypothetical protein
MVEKTFFQRNKEKHYLSGSAFSRFWNKKIQTSPFGVENALSLMNVRFLPDRLVLKSNIARHTSGEHCSDRGNVITLLLDGTLPGGRGEFARPKLGSFL